MFKYRILFLFRHVLRNRFYWLLTVLGFALGLAATLIITLSIYDDLVYDSAFPNVENTYRVYSQYINPENGEVYPPMAPTSGALAALLPERFPEVIASTRTQAWGKKSIQRMDRPVGEGEGVNVNAIFADSSFLNVVKYKLVAGDPAVALKTPMSILLTESTAKTLFGDENPINKPMMAGTLGECFVGGIIEDPPERSHMQFGMVLPIFLNEENRYWFENWFNNWVITYVELVPGTDLTALEEKMHQLCIEHECWPGFYPTLQAVKDIHLHSNDQNFNWINHAPADPGTLMIMGAIALGILLIASINFINLTTARSVKRAREVGMRKSFGATRSQLIREYLLESVVMTVASALIAIGLVEAFIPMLEPFLGKEMSGMLLSSPALLGMYFAVTVFVGLISGVYPAFVLTSFTPIKVLRGNFRTSKSGQALRRVLVVLQFSISIILVISVVIMRSQIGYMLSLDMGYDREQVLLFDADDSERNERETLLTLLNNHSDIIAAGSSNNLPSSNLPGCGMHPTGEPDEERSTSVQLFDIRGEWFKALEIPVLQGRSFYTDTNLDSANSVIINKAAADLFTENPLNNIAVFNLGDEQRRLTVVGIVDNFNFGSARDEIRPMVFFPTRTYSSRVYVRLNAGQIHKGMDTVRSIYQDIYGENLMGERFLDDHFNQQYKSDRAFAANAGIFTVFAIFIACLGIFGLTSYTIEQRHREIAIRKVLGSTEKGIFFLLSKDILKWVLISNVIAWPVAYFLMRSWLVQFVAKIPLTAIPFILAGVVILSIAFVTVFAQAIRAIRINAASSLRAE